MTDVAVAKGYGRGSLPPSTARAFYHCCYSKTTNQNKLVQEVYSSHTGFTNLIITTQSFHTPDEEVAAAGYGDALEVEEEVDETRHAAHDEKAVGPVRRDGHGDAHQQQHQDEAATAGMRNGKTQARIS